MISIFPFKHATKNAVTSIYIIKMSLKKNILKYQNKKIF